MPWRNSWWEIWRYTSWHEGNVKWYMKSFIYWTADHGFLDEGNIQTFSTDCRRLSDKTYYKYFNLPDHSHHNMTICGLSLPHGNTELQKAAKISNKNSLFNWVHSLHTELMNASHSANLFTYSCDHISTNYKAPLDSHINQNTPQFLY